MSKDKDYVSMEEASKRINSELSPSLTEVMKTKELLKQVKAGEIVFSKPIISQFGNGLIQRNTINVIQGKYGQHKSRLAEMMCAAILKRPECSNDLLEIEKNLSLKFSVLYVDTERNLKERLPYALQQIQLKAGYLITDNPENFDYLSLLTIERNNRFNTLCEYLNHVRKNVNQQHLFVVLDVATDCISDFNSVEHSMQLIDMMNRAINDFDVTFLCVIHENPHSDKARGHLGTEILNKATTTLSIAYEKDGRNNETELIKVKCLKASVSKKPDPYYVKYCEKSSGLELASDDEISNLTNEKKRKADYGEICESLKEHLGSEPTNNSCLLEKLCKCYDVSTKTMSDRLSHIVKSKMPVTNGKNESCTLTKIKGKEVSWVLTPIGSL